MSTCTNCVRCAKHPVQSPRPHYPDQAVSSVLYSVPRCPVRLQSDSTSLVEMTGVRSLSSHCLVKVWSKSGQSPVKVQSKSGQSPVKVQSKSGQSPVKVQSKSSQSPVKVQSKSAQSPVKVCSKSSQSLLKSENDQNSLSGWTPVDFDQTMTRI